MLTRGREVQARSPDTVLSPLPRGFVSAVFLLLPADTRLRCSEVSRAWRALLANATLFTSLNLSLDSGVACFSLALLRAAAAKAGGSWSAAVPAAAARADRSAYIRKSKVCPQPKKNKNTTAVTDSALFFSSLRVMRATNQPFIDMRVAATIAPCEHLIQFRSLSSLFQPHSPRAGVRFPEQPVFARGGSTQRDIPGPRTKGAEAARRLAANKENSSRCARAQRDERQQHHGGDEARLAAACGGCGGGHLRRKGR